MSAPRCYGANFRHYPAYCKRVATIWQGWRRVRIWRCPVCGCQWRREV